MKKITIATILLAFAVASFSQQVTPKQDWKESEFYKKSKSQKTIAWVMVGGGVAMIAGGLIGHSNHVNNQKDLGSAIIADVSVDAGVVVTGVGFLTALGSIPLFISSSINKKKAKAASVFIDAEKTQVLRGNAFSYSSFPVVGFKIRL